MPPLRVAAALACLGAALLIGVAILVSAWREPRLAAACLVIVGGLIWLAARRHTWASATLVIVTLASLRVNSVLGLLQFQLQYGGVMSVATGLQLALEIAGCVLLLHGDVPPRGRTRSNDG